MNETPDWVAHVMESLSTMHPEYVAVPHPHVVLVEHYTALDGSLQEEWMAVLDTQFDVMHLSLRSGSYVTDEIGERTPKQVASWFASKFNKFYLQEYEAVTEQVAESMPEEEAVQWVKLQR